MKLLRYCLSGQERPGLLDGDGRIRDLSRHVPDIGPDFLSPAGLAGIAALDPGSLPLVGGTPRLGVPVARVGKSIPIGLNFVDHAEESNLPIPRSRWSSPRRSADSSAPTTGSCCPRTPSGATGKWLGEQRQEVIACQRTGEV
jgi:2,4-didehydro-3-deoxy-L-rhamnonate hydrolase